MPETASTGPLKELPQAHEMSRGSFFYASPAWYLLLLGLLTVLVYIPGLHGPFLFDDAPNIIRPIQDWMSGKIDWVQLIFGNGSGPLGRSLSKLTFFANAASTGLVSFPFKLTNLLIHVSCGGLIYILLSRLLRLDPQLGPKAPHIAVIVAGIWLLHPMQVSTVLYIVQRMAQLSAFFALLALLSYVKGRIALNSGRQRYGLALLFVILPLFTLAATLSKENGALVPLMCGVLEIGYFRPLDRQQRPNSVKWFYAAFLALPGLALIYHYGLHPQLLVRSYETRPFTLGQHLLSEPRALMDYLEALLIPNGPSLGVYTDDFSASQSLLDPPSTLISILGLLALIGGALYTRTRIPSFFTGIFLYLAGHAMESTIFPLELYFEHRNYLPAFGFFLAIIGLIYHLMGHVAKTQGNQHRQHILINGGICAFIALLSISTFSRATVWNSWHGIAIQGVRTHPNSMRALLDYAQILQIEHKENEAKEVFNHMATINNMAARHVALIDLVVLQCINHGKTDPAAVSRVRDSAGEKLQLPEMLTLEQFATQLQLEDCEGLSRTDLAGIMVTLVDEAPQPPELVQLWRTRFNAARLYFSVGENNQGIQQASQSWATGVADPAIGIFLAEKYYEQGKAAQALRVLNEAKVRVSSVDGEDQKSIRQLQLKLDQVGKISSNR